MESPFTLSDVVTALWSALRMCAALFASLPGWCVLVIMAVLAIRVGWPDLLREDRVPYRRRRWRYRRCRSDW